MGLISWWTGRGALDVKRVERALRDAEARTSGEIRVSVAPLAWGSLDALARSVFERLGMRQTVNRNAVLFLVMPARRRLVVMGDEGIHHKVGADFWAKVVERVVQRAHETDLTEGLCAGIQMVAEELSVHFASAGERDVNELPDTVHFVSSRSES